MEIKHIIWDWNGTIFDDVKLCVDVLNSILGKYEKGQISIDDYKQKFKFPVVEYYQELGFKKSELFNVSEMFTKEYEQKKYLYKKFPDAEDVLMSIKKKGVSQSILSAYKEDMLVETTKKFELSKYFNVLSGQKDIYANGKLSQGKQLISDLNMSTENIVLIGDTLHDYEISRELGIYPILIGRGHNSLNKLKSTEAEVFNNLIDMYDFTKSKF